MKKLIIFLIRKRLGLKKFECFGFVGQKSNDYYWFTEDDVMKFESSSETEKPSSVSLHWLLDDNCKIFKINDGVDI